MTRYLLERRLFLARTDSARDPGGEIWVCKDMGYLTKNADLVWFWVTGLVLLVCVTGLGASASHNSFEGYPGDADLAKRFQMHRNDFTTLGNMLDTNGQLWRKSREAVGSNPLTELGAERMSSYHALLTNIGASALSYVPESKDTVVLLLPGDVENSARVYLVHVGPEDVAPSDRKDTEHYWRGPGVYETTRELPLGGGWFIRRKVDVSVALPLY